MEREAEVMDREDFIPKIHWYFILANYMVGNYSEDKMKKELLGTVEKAVNFTPKGRTEFMSFVDRLSFSLPELFSTIKSHLFLKQPGSKF